MSNPALSFEKRTFLLIGITALLKLLLCGLVELNNDEVYYCTYAQHLQWNYFDHPPMVALFIRFFTAGGILNHEFFIRLGSVIAAAVCTWIIFHIGKLLKDAYTGWLAACLFTASFYASIIAGMLILPDTPQLIFWLLSVYLILDIVKNNLHSRALNTRLAATGFLIGLCMLSKVHGVFLWAGFGGYILFKERRLLANPFLYTGVLITAAMLIPSYLWTLHNQFSTVNYHSSRISFNKIHPDSFFREIFGSILYNNPINVILLISGCFYFRKRPGAFVQSGIAVLWWLSLPLIGTVLFLAVFNDTLPHWSGPAYTTLIPVTALLLQDKLSVVNRQLTMPSPIKWALGLTGGTLIAVIILINYWPGSLGRKEMPAFGKGDVTLDMTGWRQFEHKFSSVYAKDRQQQLIDSSTCIFADYWFPAAHLLFYTGKPLHIPVMAVGSMGDIHHFAWLNQYVPPLHNNANAYYITVSNFYEPPPAELTRYFESVSEPTLISQERSGHVVRYFYIYRLMHYRGGLPRNGIIK
jgi:hypothetical protein